MNRRLLFTGIATLALLAGAVPVAGLGVTAVAHAVAPRPTGYPVATPPASRPTPNIAPSTPVTSSPAPNSTAPNAGDPASNDSPGDLPLAQRLRPLAPGDQLISEQQLRDFAWAYRSDPTAKGVDAWVAETSIEVTCMAGVGFYWDPRESSYVMTDPSQPVVPVALAARLALDGNAGFPYHWQDAGCRGRAIHETGGD